MMGLCQRIPARQAHLFKVQAKENVCHAPENAPGPLKQPGITCYFSPSSSQHPVAGSSGVPCHFIEPGFLHDEAIQALDRLI